MKKRILSTLLAFTLLCGSASTALSANAAMTETEESEAAVQVQESREEDWGTYEYLYYEVLDDGTVEILDYSGSDKVVEIPEKINGKRVIRIGSYVFEDCTNLESITIPDSVTSIGVNTFLGCEKLTIYGYSGSCAETYAKDNSIKFVSLGKAEIQIKEEVKSDEYECNVLANGTVEITGYKASKNNVTIPYEISGKKVTSIGQSAFENCSILTNITIPDSVTSIGGFAFAWCDNLKSVTIPDSVTIIKAGAFEGCKSLTTVFIGNSVTCIGDSAFQWCTSLKYVTFGKSIEEIQSSAFYGCSSLESISLPKFLKRIGLGAFSSTGLTDVTIPQSVTSIGDFAFSENEKIKSLTILNPDIDLGVLIVGSDSKATIYGYAGSSAEEYAKQRNINFVELPPEPELSYGDLDGDDEVSSNDALIILRAVVGLENLTAKQKEYADVNNDGSVDSADSLAILRYVVGYRDSGVKIK